MYAVIETGGKQYKVETGDVIYIEKLDVEADSDITFDKVLAVGTDDGIKVGAPYVEGANVAAKARSSPTSRRRTRSAKWATDSLTPRLKSAPSTRNPSRENDRG